MDAPDDGLLEKSAALIGAKNVLRADADMTPYLNEPRDLYHGCTPCRRHRLVRSDRAAISILERACAPHIPLSK